MSSKTPPISSGFADAYKETLHEINLDEAIKQSKKELYLSNITETMLFSFDRYEDDVPTISMMSVVNGKLIVKRIFQGEEAEKYYGMVKNIMIKGEE